MNDFTVGLIIVGVFANFGASLVIARRLRKLIKEISNAYHRVSNVEEDIKLDNKKTINVLCEILDKIPNTFEYNGNKGKVYKK